MEDEVWSGSKPAFSSSFIIGSVLCLETAPIAAFAGVDAHGRDGLAALAHSARASMAGFGLF